ncbi:hypothetical protein CS062_25275, partial [Roseateles chitinivorans]
RTTVSFYEGNKRAADAEGLALIEQHTRKGSAIDASDNVITDADHRLLTKAFFKGAENFEKQNYQTTHDVNGDVTRTTVSFYEGNKRAADAEWVARIEQNA